MNAEMKLQQAYINLIAAIAYHEFCLRVCYAQAPIDAAKTAWEEADAEYCKAESDYMADKDQANEAN